MESYNIASYIAEFMSEKVVKNRVSVYNEFSLQHELGIFLKRALKGYKVEFERNVSSFGINSETVKKEIDIVIYKGDIANASEKYAVELKYPRNGQYPEQMFSFIKDIRFMEQLKDAGFDAAFCLTAVDQEGFYSDSDKFKKDGIYSLFRVGTRSWFRIPHGSYIKPTGNKERDDTDHSITLEKDHKAKWLYCGKNLGKLQLKDIRYYIMTMGVEDDDNSKRY